MPEAHSSRRDCQSIMTLPSDPWMDPRLVVWEGRTGAGQLVRLVESGDWIEFVYYEHDGETVRGGFALNPLYGSQVVEQLVGILARKVRR